MGQLCLFYHNKKIRFNLNGIQALQGLSHHTYIVCMTVHSTKQQIHRQPLMPGRRNLGKSSKRAQGCHPAALTRSGCVRCARPTTPWYHPLSTKPKRVPRVRNSSSGRHRCETSVVSGAVQQSHLGSTGGCSCPRSRWPEGQRRRRSS